MNHRLILTALVLSISAPSLSHADSFSYEIQVGSSSGFQYSYIHAAKRGSGVVDDMADENYAVRMSGAKLFELSGTLMGDLTDTGSGWLFNVAPSTLGAKVLNTQAWMGSPTAGDQWSLKILGGSLSDVNKLVNFGGRGSLDYQIVDDSNAVKATGKWHFYADLAAGSTDAGILGGAPNSLSDVRLDLWGNNWKATSPPAWDDSVPNRLGIDLGGIGTDGGMVTVPVPSNAVNCILMLSTLLSVRFFRRR